jgi:hypothetical protein
VDDVLGVQVLEGHQDLVDQEPSDPLRKTALFARQDHFQHVTYNKKNMMSHSRYDLLRDPS